MSSQPVRRSRAWQRAVATAAAIVMTFAAPMTPAYAQVATAPVNTVNLQLPYLKPVMDCAAVVNLDLSRATDGKVTMKSASVVSTGAQPYCSVTATIAPADTFVMHLPMTGWSQRYVQNGCGGECGSSNLGTPTQASTCPVVTDASVATATTDMGHQGSGSPSGSWAANNPQAQIDFAYRGVHVTSQVAKALLTKFYGKAPSYSYFDGCSDGGREALMEAQRYPTDFNGIIGGALVIDAVTQNTYHHGWNALSNQDANGNYVLLASRLPLVHTAVLAACDGIDGLVDGLIDDPRACRFDPHTIVCPPGQTNTSACLTSAEADAVQRLHDGPVDANGIHYDHKIAHEWGSELAWTLFVPATAAGPSGSINFVTSWYRYLGVFNQALPNWQVTTTTLALEPATFWQVEQPSIYLAADDPDLSAFYNAGGKLIIWHGWSDQHVTPQGTLEYYHAMRDLMGSNVQDQFVRMYLFPGVYHCGGGEGPDTADLLTPMMNWVETGIAPTSVVASQLSGSTVTRTRPLYPYPTVARYSGSGDVNSYTSFHAYTPADVTDATDDYTWIGSPLYSHGYQASCKASGTTLVCSPPGLPKSMTQP
jgi:feruloyl esterase